MGEVKYLIDSWQAFIQQIVYLVGRGYDQYCLILYAEKHRHKYEDIDKKLIDKYQCNLNKDQKRYRKQKGYENYSFLRYKETAIILKTKGKTHERIKGNDEFELVKNQCISIRISDWITLEVRNVQDRVSVYLSDDTYREIKNTCLDHLEMKNYTKMRVTFMNLNGIPAWGGIVKQRIKMIGELKKNAKKLGYYKQINFNNFEINKKRKPVQVFR